MSPKRKVKRGVRVTIKCPRGHLALNTGRCTNPRCPYSSAPPPYSR